MLKNIEFYFSLPWAEFGAFVFEHTVITYSFFYSYYEFAFFKIIINSFSLGNVLCLLCFLLVLSNLTIAIAYLFVDEKWMNTYLKVVNCVVPVLVFMSMLFFLGEWTAVMFVLEVIYIALVICQFANPKLRKII